MAGSPLDEQLPFDSSLPVDVQLLLDEAGRSYGDTVKTIALLEQARVLAPTQLEVYYRLYKFLFYNKRLHRAEEIARQGLAEAACQAGFSMDWQCLTPDSAEWKKVDGAERFYLFTMKALAFILLRLGRGGESENILVKLAELDPEDMVGGSVIRELAVSVREQSDAA